MGLINRIDKKLRFHGVFRTKLRIASIIGSLPGRVGNEDVEKTMRESVLSEVRPNVLIFLTVFLIVPEEEKWSKGTVESIGMALEIPQ